MIEWWSGSGMQNNIEWKWDIEDIEWYEMLYWANYCFFPSFTRMFQVMSNKPMFWDPGSLSELCGMLLQFHSLLFCGLNKDVEALTSLAIPSFFHILYPRVVDASQHFLAPTVSGLTRLTNPASQVTHLTNHSSDTTGLDNWPRGNPWLIAISFTITKYLP